MKIRPVGDELFNAEGQTDRHDEANSRFSQFLLKRLKMERSVTKVLRKRITAAILTS
jgi:hypothetical protein